MLYGLVSYGPSSANLRLVAVDMSDNPVVATDPRGTYGRIVLRFCGTSAEYEYVTVIKPYWYGGSSCGVRVVRPLDAPSGVFDLRLNRNGDLMEIVLVSSRLYGTCYIETDQDSSFLVPSHATGALGDEEPLVHKVPDLPVNATRWLSDDTVFVYGRYAGAKAYQAVVAGLPNPGFSVPVIGRVVSDGSTVYGYVSGTGNGDGTSDLVFQTDTSGKMVDVCFTMPVYKA